MLMFSCIYAQSTSSVDRRAYDKTEYLFTTGDTIMFFPMNPDYKGTYTQGYTCFFNMDCMENGFKPKYRFAVNKEKLTPHSEIDGFFFYVKSINSPSFNNENKLYYSAILERIHDHALICFAYPSSLKKEPKESILHTWTVLDKSEPQFIWGKNSLVIPYIKKIYIDWLNSLEGKPVIMRSNYSKTDEELFLVELANGESKTKMLNTIGTRREFSVRRFHFLSLGNELYYSHPYVTIYDSIDSQVYSIPASHFVGNCNNRYVIRGEFKNLFGKHFARADILLARLRNESPKRDSLIGKVFFFDKNNYYYKQEDKWIDIETSFLDRNNRQYSLTNGYYKCVGFDFFRKPASYLDYYSQYVIFEDSLGQQFKFPTTISHKTIYSSHEKIDFTKIFELKEAKEERERQEFLKEENEKRLNAKYGPYLCYVITSGQCTEARYIELLKKYGKRKAEDMAGGKINVGWTFSEVLESVGKKYFECVYSHKNRYDYWEVYQYRKYSPSYVTFRNNVVVSIDDYMSTDF